MFLRPADAPVGDFEFVPFFYFVLDLSFVTFMNGKDFLTIGIRLLIETYFLVKKDGVMIGLSVFANGFPQEEARYGDKQRDDHQGEEEPLIAYLLKKIIPKETPYK